MKEISFRSICNQISYSRLFRVVVKPIRAVQKQRHLDICIEIHVAVSNLKNSNIY